MIDGKACILAIETSCDDTSAAVILDGKMLSNLVASQAIHAQYGGIVPEVASRMHQENISIVVDAALKQANVTPDQLNAIACTAGPGLMGSLTVGLSFAKAMALSLSIPFISINHMRAHVLSHFIDDPKPTFPFLCLTVSGGHTQIVLVKSYTAVCRYPADGWRIARSHRNFKKSTLVGIHHTGTCDPIVIPAKNDLAVLVDAKSGTGKDHVCTGTKQ